MRTLPLVLLLFGVAAVDDIDDGHRAYAEERFADALSTFEQALAAAGDGAAPELHDAVALAALRVGELMRSEQAAAHAARVGGAPFAARHDFIRGNVAWLRAGRAEAFTALPEAGPPAFDRAIDLVRRAGDAWQRAAASRRDWPAARRNAERALEKLAELERRKAEREAEQPPSEDDPDPPDLPPPASEEADPPDAALDPLESELSRERVLALLDKLAAKEQEKRSLRRVRRGAERADVEQDW